MKLVKQIVFLLFVFLGLFQTKVDAKPLILENEKVELSSEQGFHEQTQEREWLGLLYLQETTDQYQTPLLPYSLGSLSQNFSGEASLKSVVENSVLSFQTDKNLESHQGSCGRSGEVFQGNPDLVDAWKKLNDLDDNALDQLRKDTEFLKKFDDVVKNGKLNKHVLEGEISYEILATGQKKWKVGGVHHKTAFNNGTARIKSGTKSSPNANGYYTAKVEVYHPEFSDPTTFVKGKFQKVFKDNSESFFQANSKLFEKIEIAPGNFIDSWKKLEAVSGNDDLFNKLIFKQFIKVE